ncbi:hypothetical protein QYF36_020559 [Acer negundo]|nr:hypothetical protein QYF36_020559 [Acer negundo]
MVMGMSGALSDAFRRHKVDLEKSKGLLSNLGLVSRIYLPHVIRGGLDNESMVQGLVFDKVFLDGSIHSQVKFKDCSVIKWVDGIKTIFVERKDGHLAIDVFVDLRGQDSIQ